MRRKILPIFYLIASLLVANMAVRPASTQGTLFVTPPSIIDTTKVPGTTFSIKIEVDAGVLNLWGFGITLWYKTTVLTATMATYNTAVFPMTWPYTIDDAYNATHGYAEGSAATGYGMPGVNGPLWLMKIDFKVDDLGESVLNIDDIASSLMDPGGYTITVTIVDGYFSNTIHDIAITSLTVPPEAIQGDNVTVSTGLQNKGHYNETFTLKVTVVETGTSLKEKLITLAKDASATETTYFDTSTVTPGTYTIRAEAILATDNVPDNNWKETTIVVKPKPTHGIVGTVTDATTGFSISGATVTAVGPETRSTTTATDGTYTLADVQVGDYMVTASATGYQDQTKSATVTEGAITTLNFELTPLPTTGTITGTVTDSNTGLPITGAKVNADGYFTTTDETGMYSISGLEPKSYTVAASAIGFESQSKSATVTAGETTTVDFALKPTPVTIDNLIAKVQEFHDLGYIDNRGVKNSLMDKLIVAKAKIDADQTRTAKNILGAFINQLKAQRGKHVSFEAADILITDAQSVARAQVEREK